jgi:hypothetical protein
MRVAGGNREATNPENAAMKRNSLRNQAPRVRDDQNL